MEFINVKLSDIGEVVGGSTPSTKNPDNYDGNIAWITPKDLAGYNKVYISKGERNITEIGFKSCSTKMLPKNSVLFSSRAPIGYVAISENDLCTNQGFKSIIPNNKIDYKFLYYLLKHNKNYIASKGSGSTFKEVSGSVMKGIELSIPKNIHDQKKISKILFDIDKKIELNNEINNNLYEFNNKLFEEKILNNAEKDDWEEYLLSDISKMIIGYSYKGNELVEKSNIGMATIKNFERTGGFKLDGFKDIVPQKCKNDHYVKPFEILVACTDLTQNADIIGNAIMLLNNANYDEMIMSMDLVKLIPITDIVNNYMLYAIVNSKDFKNFALRYKSGTTVLHLNKNCFKEYMIKLPNYNTIKDLSKVFEVNYKKISQIVDENRKLEQLRDTLLPKLMNGEINLDNIDI